MTIKKTKVCTKCQVEKPVEEFWIKRSRKDGLNPQCKECIKQVKQRRIEKLKANPPEPPAAKQCVSCGEVKSSADFNRNSGNKDGFSNRCRTCQKDKEGKRYEEKKEKILEVKRIYDSSPIGTARQRLSYAVYRSVRYGYDRDHVFAGIDREELIEATLPIAEEYCRRRDAGEDVEIDHIKPLAIGGTHHPNNLQVITRIENRTKQHKDLSQYGINDEDDYEDDDQPMVQKIGGDDMKKCAQCREHRPLHEFKEDRGTSDGLKPYCIPCTVDAARRGRIPAPSTANNLAPEVPQGIPEDQLDADLYTHE